MSREFSLFGASNAWRDVSLLRPVQPVKSLVLQTEECGKASEDFSKEFPGSHLCFRNTSGFQ